MKYIQKLCVLLDKDGKRHLFWLVTFSILISIIETMGISAILPFIDIATNFDQIHANKYYKFIYEFFSFQKDVDFVIAFGLILFGFYVFRGVINMIYSYVIANFIQNIYAKNTLRLFNVYLKMPYHLFTKKNSSQLNKTIVTEATLASRVFGAVLNIISESLVIIFLYTLMLIVSWKITLIFSIILLFELAIISQTISKKIKKIGIIRADVLTTLYEMINRLFGNFKQIKLHGGRRLNTVSNNFCLVVNKYSKANTTNIFLSSFPRQFIEASGFSLIILFLVGLLYLNQSNVAYFLPTLSLFVLALYRLLPSVNRIVNSYNTLMFYHKSVDIVNDNLKFSQENLKNKKVKFNSKIVLSNIKFSYHKKVIFENVNLLINKGERIAFIGESGSGKSTLVDLIIGLYKPNIGEIKVDDVLINQSNLKYWRSQIGYISQQIYLFDGTIAENVCFGRKINKHLLNKVLIQVNMFNFLQNNDGLETLVGENGIQLSGGQKQRIAIARALYGKPEILVLDEATSALDVETEKLIMDEIYNFSKGITLLIVAHRLSTIKNCDKVFKTKDRSIKRIK